MRTLVAGATAVNVSTGDDDHPFTAKIMGTDADTDLVLLDVPERRSRVPTAGRRPRREVGEPVVAVAIDERQPSLQRHRHRLAAEHPRDDLDQRHARRTAGHRAQHDGRDHRAGGLFNTNGELVGILTSPPGVTTVGLAVPIRVADDVQDQIESSGKVTHGWLGLTADDAKDRAGATVTAVFPDSPAAAAKLEVGDVITQAGGQFIGGFDDLIAEWRRHRPGDSIAITYRRGHASTAARRPGDAHGPAATASAAARAEDAPGRRTELDGSA